MSGNNTVSRPLLILGTRTLALEVADFLRDIPQYHLLGFVENLDRERCREKLEGFPILWVEELAALAATHWGVCALATTTRSLFTRQAADLGLRFATLIHPTAYVSASTEIGEGTIVSPGAVIASHSRVGRHVFINRGALIGHHTCIGDHVTIQPGANIAGHCEIGESTYIGMQAAVLDRLRVGRGVVVGAGAVVTKNLPDAVQVLGVPARIVKENIPPK